MNDYLIEIKLLEPVAIAAQKGVGNVIPSLDYIPGSTLRGAIADMWLKANFDKDGPVDIKTLPQAKQQEFQQLFLAPGVVWGNCTIKGARFVPRTALTCKYEKGFSVDGHHGVTNIIARDAGLALARDPDIHPLSCEHCGEAAALDPFEGFYLHSGGRLSICKVKKHFMARTRISETFEAADHGALYTREALDAGQVFKGKLRLRDQADFQNLERYLALMDSMVFLGAAKSRSTGRAQIKITPYSPQWPEEQNFSSRKRFELFQKEVNLPGCSWALTATSDIIILDEFLRAKSWIDIDDIISAVVAGLHHEEQAVGGKIEAIKKILRTFHFVRGWAQMKTVSGWHAAWRMPKFDDLAISAGSVFFFYRAQPEKLSKEPLDALGQSEEELFFEAMEILQRRGIGGRLNEGFGQVIFCSYFHTGRAW